MAFDPDAFTKMLRSMGAGGTAPTYPAAPTAGGSFSSIPGLSSAASTFGASTAAPAAEPLAGAAPGLFARAGARLGMGGAGAAEVGGAAKLGLGRASIPATAGIFASGIVNKQNIDGEGSNTDQALSGAVTGAGIGAGVGLMGGPFAPISVPVGTALGAGAGALVGLFGKKGASAEKKAAKIDASTQKQLAALSAMTAGLPEDVRDTLASQLLAGAAAEKAKLSTKSKDPVEAMAAQLMAQIPQIQAQQRAAQRAQEESTQRQQALQGSISGYMAPYLQRFVDTGEKSALQYEALGKPELAANARNSAARMAAAYQAQTQSYPALFEAQQQLAYANQVNQIRQQQSLQSLYGGGSGTAGLEKLAAQQP